MSDGKLQAVDYEIVGDAISVDGKLGTYYVFVKAPNFFTTAWGIITIVLVFVTGLFVMVYFTIFKGKKSTPVKVAEVVEKRLQEKIASGQKITTEDVLKIRQEVVEELENNKNNNLKQ